MVLASSACNTTKYLEGEQRLVNKNSVKIISDTKIDNQSDIQYELSNYIKQKPNSKFLGVFRTRLWFYYRHREPSDTSKWSNWVRRIVAEPPVIHKDKFSESTSEAMTSYLQHKGYFNAGVQYRTIEEKGKLIDTEYLVYPNERYRFDSITYVSEDPVIQRILNDTRDKSFLKQGAGVDVKNYDNEVRRLVRQFRNLGYLDFTKTFISPLAVDTAALKVNATLRILPTTDSLGHRVFTVGKVFIYPNYDPDWRDKYLETEEENGLVYMSVGNPEVKFNALKRTIAFTPGELYKLDDEEETKKRLASLGSYKFVSIKPEKRNDGSQIVDFRVYLPSKKRMELGADVELNTANNSTLNNYSIGTGVSFNYKNRNLFGGAEVLTTNLETGVEFAIRNPNRTFNSLNVSLGGELAMPKFMDYLGVFHLANKIRILPDRRLNNLKETATTRLKLGFDYVNFVDFYDYYSMEGSFGYSMTPNDKWRVRFTQSGITYFNPDPKLSFQRILDENPFLEQSFGPQLFTGILFRDVTASYTGTPKKDGAAWSLRMSGEISGMEELILNRAIAPNNEWQLFNTLEYAHFMRGEFEARYSLALSPKNSIALRGISGIAFPYGKFSDAVPYVEQFTVGGPNSIRAWSIREIGPGGFVDPLALDENNTLPFYQAGDIKMEASLEYRFDMFWYFEGAFFLDVGNVWLLRNDPDRPNAKISKDFWKQFAVGTGFGMRLDFSYFIMRFDLGYPIRNNYYDEFQETYWKYKRLDMLRLDDLNFNLAIGYPF